MPTLSKFIFFCVSIISIHSANSNVINNDLMNDYCIKEFGRYSNCNFSSLSNKKITNTNTFSVMMKFKIDYDRGNCCTSRSRSECREPGKLNLKFHTEYSSENFLTGVHQIVLTGYHLSLKNLNNFETFSTNYFLPCHLVVRNIEVDFSDQAKNEINKLFMDWKISNDPIVIRNKIFTLIGEMKQDLVNINFTQFEENFNEFKENINLINEFNLTNNEEMTINLISSQIQNWNGKDKSRIYNSFKESLNKILLKIENLLNINNYNQNYTSHNQITLKLNKVLYEIENEPKFNKESYNEFKRKLYEN